MLMIRPLSAMRFAASKRSAFCTQQELLSKSLKSDTCNDHKANGLLVNLYLAEFSSFATLRPKNVHLHYPLNEQC